MNNLIRTLTGLEDPYLEFESNKEQQVELIDGYHLISLVQSNVPSPQCHKCKADMVKNGTRKPVFIHCPESGGRPLIVAVRKQKFLCKHCGASALSEIKGVKYRCSIASTVKQKALAYLSDNISVKDIAKLTYVSASTVQRVLVDSRELVKPQYDWLPQAISFDDFKSGNGSNMSMLMINPVNHRTIDVIESRKGKALLAAFFRFSHVARCQVKYVIVDLYQPYRNIIKEAFPNAIIIADPFHVITQAYRALQSVRISVMKHYGSDSREYRALKSLWKLIMKDQNQLRSDNFRSRRNFRHAQLSDDEVVDRLLAMSEELKVAYEYYQTLLEAMSDHDSEQLEELLKIKLTLLPKPLQKTQRTLRQHKEEILNQFKHQYSNGIIEGRMNRIKVIKRTAFGYRSFENFKTRILLECRSVSFPIENPSKEKRPTIRQRALAV